GHRPAAAPHPAAAAGRRAEPEPAATGLRLPRPLPARDVALPRGRARAAPDAGPGAGPCRCLPPALTRSTCAEAERIAMISVQRLTRTSALAAAVAAMAGGLAAPATAQEAKVLTVARASQFDSLDPARQFDDASNTLVSMIYST